MISGPTEEQEELRDLTRRFLSDKSSLGAVRALVEEGITQDEAVWSQMADQLGLQGLAIPEELGGSGMGPAELAIVCEELGRALYAGPFFSTVVLASQALIACDDHAAKRAWLPRIAAGEVTATLTVSDATGEIDSDGVRTSAEQVGDTWVLRGSKRFVVDGASAQFLIVAARVTDGIGLFLVEGDAPGLTRTPVPGLDLTRPLADLDLDAVTATRIVGDAGEVIARVADLAAAHLAAEQAGGAAAALEMAVDYAKIRVQFDRPIGSFQAIKHKCADLLLAVESARNAAFAAASLLAAGDPEGPLAASLAAAWAGRAYTRAAKENIQVHGGIGFTWEHDAHLFLRRAKSTELLFGSPARHRARVADLAGV